MRADVTVDVVLRYLRLRGEMPEHTDHLYVVSRRHQYLGRVALAALLTHEPGTPINELIDDEQPAIASTRRPTRSRRQFSDHDWISAPVVDDNNILLGRITIDDVVDIIREQAEHQALSAAGLDEDEDMFSPVPRAARRRALWLGINLAHRVPGLVGDRPLRGHAGADRRAGGADADRRQHGRRRRHPGADADGARPGAGPGRRRQPARAAGQGSVGRRCSTARSWAMVVGVVAWLWFQDAPLGLVIAAAMLINLFDAALAGVLVPLTLRRMNIDPALAGGVVLTTVTDVIGFLSFLGLATLVLLK